MNVRKKWGFGVVYCRPTMVADSHKSLPQNAPVQAKHSRQIPIRVWPIKLYLYRTRQRPLTRLCAQIFSVRGYKHPKMVDVLYDV